MNSSSKAPKPEQPRPPCDFCAVGDPRQMERRNGPHGPALWCPKCKRFYGYLRGDGK